MANNPVDIKLAQLEVEHKALKEHVITIRNELDERIDNLEESVKSIGVEQKSMRLYMSDSFDELKNITHTIIEGALNSSPKWAEEEKSRLVHELRAKDRTNGVQLGIIVSLVIAIAGIVIGVVVHMH